MAPHNNCHSRLAIAAWFSTIGYCITANVVGILYEANDVEFERLAASIITFNRYVIIRKDLSMNVVCMSSNRTSFFGFLYIYKLDFYKAVLLFRSLILVNWKLRSF